MMSFGAIGFTSPLLLLGLIALPILWLLLRAVPPAPLRRRFPGVVLLLGLADRESQSDRTPWWLLLLRLLAVAAVIVGFAGPVLNPVTARDGSGDLVIVFDGSWVGAPGWAAKLDRADALLSEAAAANRPVALVNLSDLPDDALQFAAPNALSARLPNIQPQPWQPDGQRVLDWLDEQTGDFETYWLSDGLDWPGRADVLETFGARGPVRAFQTPRQTVALRPARYEDGVIISGVRSPTGAAQTVPVAAIGLDPAGVTRTLATVDLEFGAGDAVAEAALDVPSELRNRISRFEMTGLRAAGAVSLTDDSLRRREVALIAGRDDREGLELLSPLYYLREALSPTADLLDGDLADLIPANPDVIVLADVATVAPSDAQALTDWIDQGGMLLRFAGPRLAATDTSVTTEDPLMPVRLRAGGRSVGGAMSWGEPKALAPFTEGSPFFGLVIPDDVTVTSQVMAQPDPTLADRVIAQLADGTPLITRKRQGDGQIILVHVTANAEWSNLPLSGLFVQMLERLAISNKQIANTPVELAGTNWLPQLHLDGFGDLSDATSQPAITGDVIANNVAGPDLRPGVYADEDRSIAVNVVTNETVLAPAVWPASVPVEGMEAVAETLLKGWLLAAALALLTVDILATLFVGGRLRGPRADMAAMLALAAFVFVMPGTPAAAQATDDSFAIRATSEVVLAHVLTGDTRVDDVAQAGLVGLSDTLFRRTSIEPATPLGVDIETDELAFFPFLYWPITTDQPLPSREGYAKLNRYLRGGGMILFDTRDGDTARFGSGSPEGRKLQSIALGLDIPPIEPIPGDHVLTRTFYLLGEFPGRYNSGDIWVEATPMTETAPDGMPFRNLNDGVTPVVIGGNDWASAWAIDANGNRMFPVGRGTAGEQQREYALRFGVNLIMHVLTGNYKSDQVHVPALLDRLGQ